VDPTGNTKLFHGTDSPILPSSALSTPSYIIFQENSFGLLHKNPLVKYDTHCSVYYGYISVLKFKSLTGEIYMHI
jgi:hypothetical protein